MYVARLHEIKSSIYAHNATLYRACANANPHNMNGAMTGISNEVSAGYTVEPFLNGSNHVQIQQLLVLMESDAIKNSIDNLIKARPCASTASASDSSSALTKSLNTPYSKENRHASMKRKSVALPAKCNCGKCSKCMRYLLIRLGVEWQEVCASEQGVEDVRFVRKYPVSFVCIDRKC